MAFTGKATYSAGADLPELAEDVSDVIGLISPHETPLLDHLGDAQRVAHSTVHEWLEDELLPHTDAIDHGAFADPAADTEFDVAHGERFRVGDQIQAAESGEVMLVTAVAGDTLTVTRGYGGTEAQDLSDGQTLRILGNAALEGDDAPEVRFTTRARRRNYTQIFSAAVEVSGSQLAARQLAIRDELDYQKLERLRELMRDLENCVINGVSAASTPEGGASVRRTMRGLIPSITTHRVDGGGSALDEATLSDSLRSIWSGASSRVDTIVVNGFQKRQINAFLAGARRFAPDDDRFRDLVSVYESDFGLCRVVLSRWMPADAVLLLDSSRIEVLPLSGRSFHFKPLPSAGDREAALVLGEYTLELRNENAHGVIRNLAT